MQNTSPNPRGRRLLLVLLPALALALPAGCAPTPNHSGSHGPTRGDVDPISSRSTAEDLARAAVPPRAWLVPGDVLRISVHGHPDLEVLEARVTASGIIQPKLIGDVQAAGRTIPELSAELKTAYEERHLTVAPVSVSVVEYTPRRVYIQGAVKREGDYQIPTGKNLDLLQLISMAGGFTDQADREDLTIIRRSPAARGGVGAGDADGADGAEDVRVFRVSYDELVANAGAPGWTILHHPDDTVIVGQERKIYVFGRVNSPGAFPLEGGGLTVMQAIALAGGFQRIANEEGTIVIRKLPGGRRVTFEVPVETIVEDPERTDFPLEAGDIVYVPEGLF